jgi:hypothetical protein
MPVAVGPSELSTLLLALCVLAIPIGAFAFSRSGKGWDEIGKGTFSIDREEPSTPGSPPPEPPPDERDEEVRQMVEAAAYRRRARGESELDVNAEIDRVLGLAPAAGPADDEAAGSLTPAESDAVPDEHDEIRSEIRQLVVANNERRERRGEEPLDVETEVDRRLRDWT